MGYIDPLTGVEEEEIEWNHSEEVDDILGFDLDAMESTDRTGLRALIGSAVVAHRRLPALDVIFERASRNMSKTLRGLAGDALDVSLDTTLSARFEDFLSEQQQGCVFAPIQSDDLDGYGLITVDGNFIFAMVDLLLGGHRAITGLNDDNHVFTSIELALIRRVLVSLCQDISDSFSAILPNAFQLDRVETSPRFAAITQNTAVCAVAKFRIDMGDASGTLRIVLPYVALEPVRESLRNEYAQENETTKNRWQRTLIEEVCDTALDLSVVLAEKEVTLGDIATMKEGDLWTLDSTLKDPISVRVKNHELAKGVLGRSGERFAVQVITELPTDKALPSAISMPQKTGRH